MATQLVIEWTRSSVRLALAEGRGAKSRLRAVHVEPISATGEGAAAVRSFLQANRVAPEEVIGVVPREQVLTRLVKFPTTEWAEIAQMAELYAKAQLPYPREQTVMDCSLLAQESGFSTVAIVACQRNVIDRQLALLREAGLSPSLVTVSSWGVLGWYQRAARSVDIQEPCLVVNVDETRTDLVLIGQRRILSTRSLSQGTRDWGTAGAIPELVATELERSRAAIRKELPGTEVRSLLVTGLGPLAEWKEELSRRLGVPVVIIDPREPLPLKDKTAVESASVSPVVVIGLAMSDIRGMLNLSPSEMRSHVSHRQQVRELVLVSVLLAAALGLGATLLGLQLARQRKVATAVDHALETLGPTAKALQEKSRSVQLVDSILQSRRRLAATLAGVFDQTPATVTLEGLTFERSRRELSVKGQAATTQAVLEYMKQLERVEGVRKVELKHSTQRLTPAGERTSFELVLHQP